jgi:release factor glutamine methyltransferase
MHSIHSALLQAQALLNSSLKLDAADARFESQLLLQHLLDTNRAWLIVHENDTLQPDTQAKFEALVMRRLQGEPMAYILGMREFYGLPLQVTPDTLIPRPDTEILVEAALAKIPASEITPTQPYQGKSEPGDFHKIHHKTLDPALHRNGSLDILDLGTGSGAIALAIAKHRPQASVTGLDASLAAIKVAEKNAAALQIRNVQFLLSDWFTALENQRFDLIVSNPPYIEQGDMHLSQGDLRFEPLSALASGADGLDDIRRIINDCLVHLKPQGWLMLEHGYNQAAAVADLMTQSGLVQLATFKDLGGNDRVTIGKNPLIVSTHWS